MKAIKYLPLLMLLLAASCKNPGSAAANHAKSSVVIKGDSIYVPTGFYFLTDGTGGIKMKMENSDQYFHLNITPFASVDNIASSTIEAYEGGGKELCLKFDAQGTKDLEAGTGNPFHNKIAVVVANKLLYVVGNTTKIRTGIMNIYVDDYPDTKKQAMLNAIKNKR